MVESALKWVYDNRNAFENPITTVNLSLGANWNSSVVPSWATLEDELLRLNQAGIVVVASAGNSFQQNPTPGLAYPAASPYVIPVASVDADGSLSGFSQRDARVIAAPGRNVMSTVPDHFWGAMVPLRIGLGQAERAWQPRTFLVPACLFEKRWNW